MDKQEFKNGGESMSKKVSIVMIFKWTYIQFGLNQKIQLARTQVKIRLGRPYCKHKALKGSWQPCRHGYTSGEILFPRVGPIISELIDEQVYN